MARVFWGLHGKAIQVSTVKVLHPKFKTQRIRNTTVPCGKINQFHLWTYCMYIKSLLVFVFITTFFLPKLQTFWTGDFAATLEPMEISDVFSPDLWSHVRHLSQPKDGRVLLPWRNFGGRTWHVESWKTWKQCQGHMCTRLQTYVYHM